MRAEHGLILLVGLPGSGKSTLARALADALGYVHIDRDAIRAALFPDCRFTEPEKAAANEAVHAAVAAVLERGRTAVVDGMTFARRTDREGMRALAAEHGAWLRGFFLDCPLAVAQARVEADTHPAGDRDAGLVSAVAARLEAPDEPDIHYCDATAEPAALLREVLIRLGRTD